MKSMHCFLGCAIILAAGCATKTGPTVIDPDAPQEFTTTESGLQYRILRRGNGNKPTKDDRVVVDYTGKLTDGTVFDSSYGSSQPTEFSLGGVIAGWTEGLTYVSEGGMIELKIPWNMAYGERGKPPTIPPKSDLNFRVELLEIK